jgi:hypothetical protein
MTDLTPPFASDPAKRRNGTPFVGQSTVNETEPAIANDGWFPDIDMRDFRLRRQISDSHAAERLADVLQLAMAQVNTELQNWQCQHGQRYDSLAAMPSPELGGCSTKVLHYRTAVYSTAQAILNHRYWAVADTTGKAQSLESLTESADEYQRERWNALQDLRGESRTLSGAL